jgi:hypothetical protein
MSDINCPYCDAELYVCHDDGYGYEENVNHQMECHKCEKSFVFQTSISFYYEAERADCLNDGNHNWKKNHTQPSYFTKMECSMCGETREPTADERKEFNIPSYEEYCKEVYGDTK